MKGYTWKLVWNEEDHPRHPKGTDRGGQFAAKDWLEKYSPDQPREPAGGEGGGRWTSGGATSFFGNTQAKPQPKKPRTLQTPGARIRFGLGGDQDNFEIQGPDGSRGSGYWRNVDFPGEYSRQDRGEVFFITAGSRKRQGIGTGIARDMLSTMRENGTRTVNFFPTTPEGKALVEKLVREGDIELIRTSPTKSEYKIMER